jgi:hypothetical protein
VVAFLHGGSPFKVWQPDSFRIRLNRRSTFNYGWDILKGASLPVLAGRYPSEILVQSPLTLESIQRAFHPNRAEERRLSRQRRRHTKPEKIAHSDSSRKCPDMPLDTFLKSPAFVASKSLRTSPVESKVTPSW